jgi:uncharacterized protein YbjQ (UPF0145 family)
VEVTTTKTISEKKIEKKSGAVEGCDQVGDPFVIVMLIYGKFILF